MVLLCTVMNDSVWIVYLVEDVLPKSLELSHHRHTTLSQQQGTYSTHPDCRSTPNCVKLSRNIDQTSANNMWTFEVYTRLSMSTGVRYVYPTLSDVYGIVQ